MKRQYLPQLLMIVSSAFWGASFIFTKGLFIEEGAITPSIILTGRMLIATVFTMPMLALTRRLEPIKKGHLRYFLLLAFTEPFLYSICETGGVRYVSGSLASIIVATIPLFVPLAMSVVYKERIGKGTLFGIVLSLVGVALMSLDENFAFSASPLGLILLACAVFIAVVYTLLLVKVLNHYHPITITAYQNLIGLFYFLPMMLILDHEAIPMLSFSPSMWFKLGFLGLFCSTLAYMCFNYGMRKLGASRGTVYNNLIPVFSLMLALVIGQERFNWLQAVGMLVVLVGLTIAQRKKSVAADGVA